MKIDIKKTIEIPEGVEVNVDGERIVAKAKDKQVEKTFNLYNVKVEGKDKLILLTSKKSKKRESKLIGSVEAHIKNIFNGLKGYYGRKKPGLLRKKKVKTR